MSVVDLEAEGLALCTVSFYIHVHHSLTAICSVGVLLFIRYYYFG